VRDALSLSVRTTPLLSADSTQRLDRWWQSAAPVASYALMKRAASALFSLITERFDTTHVLVLTGGGNNGGDGWTLASMLHCRGYSVEVVSCVPPNQLAGDAARAFADCPQTLPWATDFNPDSSEPTLMVDAMLGVGFKRPLRDSAKYFVSAAARFDCPILAVDVPSGIDATTGSADECIMADVTVTFFNAKLGMTTGKGKVASGEVIVEPLGMTPRDFDASGISSEALWVHAVGALPSRPLDSFKHRNGHVWVVAGEDNMIGGSLMAAQSALCCGAGLVTMLCESERQGQVQQFVPELMTSDLSQFLNCESKAADDVVVVGPGWLPQAPLIELMTSLAKREIPTVIDAGALRAMAQHDLPDGRWILTPHTGEAAALLGCTIKEIEENRVKAARQLADTYGATVVLKGPGTILSDGASTFVLDAGSPALATAGSGDVLCGVIAACIVACPTLLDSVIAASYYHARAGEMWADAFGTRGARATEFIPIIRAVLNGRGKEHVFSR